MISGRLADTAASLPDPFPNGLTTVDYRLLKVPFGLHGDVGEEIHMAEILGIGRGKVADRIHTFGIQLEQDVRIG